MSCRTCTHKQPCLVPPHPDIAHLYIGGSSTPAGLDSGATQAQRPLGLNDGAIFGRSSFPPNTSDAVIAKAALDQPNLRGPINVIVVLVNFKDKSMKPSAPQYFRDLFFSKGTIGTGSVTEYYTDVSGKMISITGDVVGPFTLPQTAAYYANGGFGIRGPALESHNLADMAEDTVDAVEAANIDLKKYDNKGRADGHVDAFIIVHAGSGGEETNDPNDMWSCKWTLRGDETREVGPSKTRVYSYLTIPEDAKLGVCAHELGHLLFGWPDLYDINASPKSQGVGNWCLMGGGSWGCVGGNAQGTTPCHPSAWCKLDQGWVQAIQDGSNSAEVVLDAVGTSLGNAVNANVHKLWSNGKPSTEYFLIENRTRSGYDASLPGEGLLIWHVDDYMAGSNDSANSHFHVALVDAGGEVLLRDGGDDSNPFPGSSHKRNFDTTTNPSSKSYAGLDTHVAVSEISDPGQTMKMHISVN